MNFLKRLNKKGDKITFYYDFGRGTGQRPTTGIFVYAKPKTALEKQHNKEAFALLKVKESEAIIESRPSAPHLFPRINSKRTSLTISPSTLRKIRGQVTVICRAH